MNRRDFLKASSFSGGAALLAAQSPATAGGAEAGSTPLVTSITPAVTAKLPDFKPAEWIWYPSGRCLANTFVLFRRVVELRGKPQKATGWICADSRYQLEVNGARVQWGPAPCDPRWAEADPVDLTEVLKAGKNVIGSTVLFYGHGDGTWPIGKPGFLFWLEIEHADGSKEKIVSDAGWQSHLCRAWKPGQYKRWFLRALQEEFDARLYPYGWSTTGFSTDKHWLPAMLMGGSPNQPALMTKYYDYATGVRTGPAECELRPRSIPLLREVIVPVKQLTESWRLRWLRPAEEYFESRTPNAFAVDPEASGRATGAQTWEVQLEAERAAALTFELEEQIVGWPRFVIEAPAGTIVEALFQEGHQAGGAALLENGRDSWTRFICREGVNEFEVFDYESLRWLQLHIRGGRGKAVVRDVGVRRRIYPWPHEPVVRTDEPALARLFTASINTLHNSAQDVIVDGMGRERQQYSGDRGHQLHAIRMAFGETQSPARFLSTFSQGMSTEGYFLDCWPGYDRLARVAQRQLDLFHFGAILDHGVQFNFDCWHHYEFTGNLNELHEPYPRLLRFARFLRSLINRDGDGLLPVDNLGIPCVWMDYQAYAQSPGAVPAHTQRRKQCAFNLYVAGMLHRALSPICRAFGDDRQAEAAIEMGAQLYQAAVKRFWSREHGMFVNNLPWLAEEKKITLCDRSLATSILYDQCPEGDTRAAVKALAECPREMGLSYPANAGWRLRALAKAGRADVVVNDLRERWATMDSVKWNNTLQESWKTRVDSGSQWSHCAVAPLYVAFQSLAGIRPIAPGFKQVQLRPQLADLKLLELTAHTVRGPLRFHARGDMGGREVTIQLPPGCEGELVLRREEAVNLPPSARTGPDGHRRYVIAAGAGVTLRLAHT